MLMVVIYLAIGAMPVKRGLSLTVKNVLAFAFTDGWR